MYKLIRVTATCFFLSLILIKSIQGQGYEAISLSMAGAHGGVARGVSALPWNPANLALPRSTYYEINFIGLNLNFANSSLNIDNYKRYFTESGHEGVWDSLEIAEILDLIPGDGLKASTDVKFNALGMVIGNYGYSVQFIGKAFGTIPKSLIELALEGNTREEYRFNDFDADGFSAVKFNVGGAYPIPLNDYFDHFAVGLNLNYYRAIALLEVLKSEGFFFTGTEYINTNVLIEGRTAQGGNGFSIDLGAAGVINKDWTVSLALQNLIGGIRWNSQPEMLRYSLIVDSADYKKFEDIEDKAKKDTESIETFNTGLPTVFHLGVAYQMNPKLLLAVDLEQAFDDKLGYTDRGELALGAQYFATDFLPIRGGMSFGGKWGYTFALGAGAHIGLFRFNLAYAMHHALWPTKSTGFSTAFDLKYTF